MKYGLILNKNNLNIGDDIQAFATARFLPQVDYFIDREYMDDFRPEEDEPVAVIMNARLPFEAARLFAHYFE